MTIAPFYAPRTSYVAADGDAIERARRARGLREHADRVDEMADKLKDDPDPLARAFYLARAHHLRGLATRLDGAA